MLVFRYFWILFEISLRSLSNQNDLRFVIIQLEKILGHPHFLSFRHFSSALSGLVSPGNRDVQLCVIGIIVEIYTMLSNDVTQW